MAEKRVGKSGILSRPLLDAGGSTSLLLNVTTIETEKNTRRLQRRKSSREVALSGVSWDGSADRGLISDIYRILILFNQSGFDPTSYQRTEINLSDVETVHSQQRKNEWKYIFILPTSFYCVVLPFYSDVSNSETPSFRHRSRVSFVMYRVQIRRPVWQTESWRGIFHHNR
jgi:hypothetical protein